MNSVRPRCARWFLLFGVVAMVLLTSLDAVLAEGKGKGGGGQGKGKGKGGGGVDNAIIQELQDLLPLFAKLDNNPKDFKQLERAFHQLLGIVMNDNAKGNMGKGMAQVGKKGQGQQQKGGGGQAGKGQGGKGQAGKGGGGKGGMMCGNVGQQAGKNGGKKQVPNNPLQNGAGKQGQGAQAAKKAAPMNAPKLQPKNAFAKTGQAPQNMQPGKAQNKAGPVMQQKFQGAKAPLNFGANALAQKKGGKGPGGGGQQYVMNQRAPQFFAVAGKLGGKAGATPKR